MSIPFRSLNRRRCLAGMVAVCAGATLLVACAPRSMGDQAAITTVRDIGSRRELFVDSWLVDRVENAAVRLHHPQPQEIAISFDAPWEGLDPSPETIAERAAAIRRT